MATFNGGWGKDRMYGNNKTTDWGGRNDDMFGHEDNDTMYGMRGNDRLFGGDGNDTLVGGEGNDDLFGDSGNDTLIYERGNDSFNGGSGTDTLQFREILFMTTSFDAVSSVLTFGMTKGINYNVTTGAVRHVGGDSLGTLSLNSVEKLTFTEHNDLVTNNNVGRTVETFGGNDIVRGGNGADTVKLGDDNDFVDGGRGNDNLQGGAGIDEVSFASWNDVSASSGSTLSTLISLRSPFDGLGQAKLISKNAQGVVTTLETDALTGFENVTGTKFNDTITGTDGANRIHGENGNDVISGRGGNDNLTGGAGDDRISGGTGADIMAGGTGNDTLDYGSSTSGVNVNLLTGRGFGGDAQGDTFSSFENITGSGLADELKGNTRANVLKGNAGSDTIDGFFGNDKIDGGSGRDFITGGMGKDTLTGGAGNDDFIFNATAESTASSLDTITDFVRGSDRIDLSAIDAILGNAGNDNFTAFIPVFVQPLPGDPPAIPTVAGAGTLVLIADLFDKDGDGVSESFLNTVSGHVDADNQADFQLQVITSFDNGRLTGSDFLL